MLFNDRRANKRALKAANGPSLAPKGYKPDTEARTIAQNNGDYFTRPWKSRKSAMAESAKEIDANRGKLVTNYVKSAEQPGKFSPDYAKVPRAPKNKKGK
jgi:hypothetical protein